jgi:hypothetical protein
MFAVCIPSVDSRLRGNDPIDARRAEAVVYFSAPIYR